MSSLTATPLPVLPRPVAATAAPAFGTRILVGLLGVLLAVLCAGLNEWSPRPRWPISVVACSSAPMRGAWLIAVYSAASVSAMAFSPWLAATLFSLRRFTPVRHCRVCPARAGAAVCAQPVSLMLLRTLQGLASGALPPMLMSVALRFLPPGIKVYGLAGYALTATFGPNLGTPLARLWTEYVGWQWAFWQIILPSLLAMACVAWGLPQDPLRLERFRQFDWRGLLLGLPAICTLVIGLTLGIAWAGSIHR
nr:multidrug efflux MFS transporter [Pseudomonas sp. BIGb0427]